MVNNTVKAYDGSEIYTSKILELADDFFDHELDDKRREDIFNNSPSFNNPPILALNIESLILYTPPKGISSYLIIASYAFLTSPYISLISSIFNVGAISNIKLFDVYNDNTSEILMQYPNNKHLIINDTVRPIVGLDGVI